jgi:hypothetical protein
VAWFEFGLGLDGAVPVYKGRFESSILTVCMLATWTRIRIVITI